MPHLIRIFKPVAELTSQEWQLMTDKALKVLNTTAGIVESIYQRERIALYIQDGELVGLVTVDIWPCEFQGVKTVALYTGNAWYHPDFRGRNLSQSLALRCFLEIKRRYPRHRCYWIFGSSNYKSYLLMLKNCRQFWPRYDRETPAWELGYLRLMAEHFYHHTWEDGAYGVIPSEAERSFMPNDTTIPPALFSDPHIQFYQAVNPDYLRGAKLICGASFDAATLSIVLGRALTRIVDGYRARVRTGRHSTRD